MRDLKAYDVREDCENTGGIYYAKHRITALKNAASELGDGDINGWAAHRAPWADEYSPGPCPKLVMIEAGWWFECSGCGCRIDYDYVDEGRALKPVERKAGVFCTEECYLRDQTQKAQIKAREAEAIEWMAHELLHKIPGITLVGDNNAYCPHYDGGLAIQQCVVAFTFPGAKIGNAQYRFDRVGELPRVSVCGGDHDAWITFRSLPEARKE